MSKQEIHNFKANETILFLFVGQTGIQQRVVLSKLDDFAKKYEKEHYEYYRSNFKAEKEDCPDFYRSYKLSDISERSHNVVFKEIKSTTKYEKWETNYSYILADIIRNPPRFASVFFHSIWRTEENSFCPLNLSLFIKGTHPFVKNLIDDKRIQIIPRAIITLIDNLDSIQNRITQMKKKEGSPKYRTDFRLKELAFWRNMEIEIGRTIAQSIYGQFRGFHYVFSIRHPISNLAKLVFEPDKFILYSAFPISRTRNITECIKLINKFRDRIYTDYVILDPLTIDEYPMISCLFNDVYRKQIADQLEIDEKFLRINDFDFIKKTVTINGVRCSISDRTITPINEVFINVDSEEIELPDKIVLTSTDLINLSERTWPLYLFFREEFEPIVSFEDLDKTVFADEVTEIVLDIMSQIRHRDFAMIESSDGIIAFRPYWDGKYSEGVQRELRLSHSLQERVDGKFLRVFYRTEDDEFKFHQMKGVIGKTEDDAELVIEAYSDLDKMFEYISQKQNEKISIFSKHFKKYKTDKKSTNYHLMTYSEIKKALLKWYAKKIPSTPWNAI